jgi:hypothetical protein
MSTQFASQPLFTPVPQQKSSGSTSQTQASQTESSQPAFGCSLQQLLGSGVSVGRTVLVGGTVFVGVAVGCGTGVSVGGSGMGFVAMTPTVMLPSEPQAMRVDIVRAIAPTKTMTRKTLARSCSDGRIVKPTSASRCFSGYSGQRP